MAGQRRFGSCPAIKLNLKPQGAIPVAFFMALRAYDSPRFHQGLSAI